MASEMVLVLDSIKVRPCLAANSVISSWESSFVVVRHGHWVLCFGNLKQGEQLFPRGEQLFPACHSHWEKGDENIYGRAGRGPKELSFQFVQHKCSGQEIAPSRVGRGNSLDYSLVRSCNNCSTHRHHKVLVTALRQEHDKIRITEPLSLSELPEQKGQVCPLWWPHW